MMIIALLLVQAVAAAPTPEAEALGLRLARSGTMATILPLMAQKETDELVAAHPELTPAEQAKLRDTAKATFATNAAKVDAAFARAYAGKLSVTELRALAEQAESAPAKRLRAVLPTVMAEAMGTLGALNFKGDTLAAFCRDTGKACPK
ncbi:hypothetical protein M0208_09710 [Sphingomonas sp. SUN019]|uniref:hypothetical protein n=1 Tax=Sphingomonas sp. SUN019 TaxID=2937788 RepID=UPI00216455F2|nr:hypothetical protein [Sphingomonas sp. SUN019]UVO50781.1 hypothetical protein M0208_09710 [Sphingomonas sp. SUN019]